MMSRRQFGIIGAAAALFGGFAASRGFSAGKSDKAAKQFEITRTAAERKKLLTPEQYYVLREPGTEYAFTSPLDKNYAPGTYHCAGCDLPLFSSETKYNSGTGWPSFWKPLDNAIGTSEDYSLFMMKRIEV